MINYTKILVVRTDRIGDVVLSTPALRLLRDACPNAKISILVSKTTFDLVEGNPDIDEIIVDDKEGENKGLAGYLKLVTAIKKKRFELAVVFHTKKRTNLLCYLAGIPRRVGFKDKKFGFLLTDPIKDARFMGEKHESEYCLDVLRHVGISGQGYKLFVPIKDSALEWVEKKLFQSNVSRYEKQIALHLGASDPSKCWPPEKFAEFINQYSVNKNIIFLLIGADNIKSQGEVVVQLSKRPLVNLIGQTTVAQMAALISKCDLLVSNDSGPVHVASGLGVPVVSIFTRNQPGINCQRWRPLGEKSRFVTVEFDDTISFEKAGTHVCHNDGQITVEQVVNQIQSILIT